MAQQSETVEEREGHAVRASHAKSSEWVTGKLIIADDLPSELAQGLFAMPGTYNVAIRFAQGPGETLGDRVSTHRGIGIKVFAVKGEKLAGHDALTQNFVLATGRTFPSGTASGFLNDAKKIGAATPAPEGLKGAVSSMARNFNKVLSLFDTAYAKADFFGHPFSHPIGDDYFSQAPVRYGDYVAKLGAVAASQAQDALGEWQLDPHEDEDGFRRAAIDYFRDHEAVFQLKVQLWADAETQPIEGASVEWPVQDSQYRTVATIRIPAQEAYSPARVRYFDEVMTFRPAGSLAAHRPLGSILRARVQVYRAVSTLRHRENGITEENTADITAIPA
jgi:hypothetical protein